MSLGPLQVMIVNFEDTNFTGEIEAELVRLETTGVLRVLDIIFVNKSLDGELTVIRTDDVHTGALSRALLGLDPVTEGGGVSQDDVDAWKAADAIAPGQAAGIMVLEHRWAIPLGQAITAAGGVEAATEWVGEAELERLGVALPSD